MKRKLADVEQLSRYRQDEQFALAARMIVSIAFVPVEHVGDIFDELAEQSPQELEPVLDWFEDTYVGRRNRFGRCRGRDWTNNFAEMAHRRLRSELGVDHPTIRRFIDGFRTVQAGRDQQFESFLRGDEPPQKRLKYLRADERIRRLVENFTVESAISYLRGLADNVMIN
uniref:Uncharacterized protein n=1 Tax=Trichuris muris TaxID=70415 RepID=A0A5S6R3D0_TRIMR